MDLVSDNGERAVPQTDAKSQELHQAALVRRQEPFPALPALCLNIEMGK